MCLRQQQFCQQICFACSVCKRSKTATIKEISLVKNMEKEDSVKESFMKNINPNTTIEVRKCWVGPDMLDIGELLGRGKVPDKLGRATQFASPPALSVDL